MATVYADIRKTTNGTGSYTDPWQRSQVGAGLNNGDKLILLDRTPTATYTAIALGAITATTDITIEGDTSLASPIRLDGAQRVSGAWVQQTAPNDSVWALAGVTASVQRVTWDYGITSGGWGYGFLNATASVAACQAATNAYYYDAGATTLYVNVGGLDPTAHIVETCLAGPGLQFTAFSNITLRYLELTRWCSGTANNGRGLSLATSGSGLTLDGVWAHDCSHQAVSTSAFTGEFAGLQIRNSTFGGMGAGARILLNFGTNAAITFGIADSKFYVGAWYDPDGDRVAAANAISACGLNIAPTGGTTTSGMVSRCKFRHQDEDIALPFRFAASDDVMAAPANPEDWTTYACKIHDSNVSNGNCIYGDTRWSAYRCHFDTSHAETDGTLTHSWDFGSDCTLLFDDCRLVGGHATNSVAAGSGDFESFHLAGGADTTNATVRTRGCQIIDATSTASGYMIDVAESRSGTGIVQWDMKNCHVIRRTEGALFSTSGSTFSSDYVSLARNRYTGIEAASWSDNTSYDSFAEWVANVEPTASQEAAHSTNDFAKLQDDFNVGNIIG